MSDFTNAELMTVAAARELRSDQSCLVGVGRPSTAAILAKRLHAPGLTLIYESGTLGADPERVPLSIGDNELATTATAVVPVAEIFNYWLQPGRISVGFLGAAQIDRFGNLNTTVIGEYEHPRTRLPGAGGAPEIATACPEIVVTVPHSRRAFVPELDFVTSVCGSTSADGAGDAAQSMVVVTDHCVMRTGDDGELELTELFPGVTVADVQEQTGWELRTVENPGTVADPTPDELAGLRSLNDTSKGRKK